MTLPFDFDLVGLKLKLTSVPENGINARSAFTIAFK